ncbi:MULTISPECIES: hypothetical protein [unclassified Caballeronia]|uniref:hypothetical protein n=1 Tax=unclassified Caballeronia TaxID=2646786 RepID=UPI0028563E2C|nr:MULTISPECIES: hypothetical protein [unclassified Caballeronia]MDR5741009.1 hypothetical protein [Caballeronia sp. LZ016]MDR5806908.1 hypothetical protein [Caballeronia sp. LZ019]
MSELKSNAIVIDHEADTPSNESPAAPARPWAWRSTREPYDWMDAHTPLGALDSWQG